VTVRTALAVRIESKFLASAEQDGVMSPDGQYRYNSPPNWPTPPEGWTPPPGWLSDPAWRPAPDGWQFWVPVGQVAKGTPRLASSPIYGSSQVSNMTDQFEPAPLKRNPSISRALLLGLTGVILLIFGPLIEPLIGIFGFILMIGALAYGIQAIRQRRKVRKRVSD
jgi:hypothetical protein